MQCYCCCFNLGQVGLVRAVQGPGLHMLWYQALGSEDVQSQPLCGWAHVWVDHSVCLCKDTAGHKRQGYYTAEEHFDIKTNKTREIV